MTPETQSVRAPQSRTSPSENATATHLPSRAGSPILLATTEDVASAAPARLAQHLAARWNTELSVVTVIEPPITYGAIDGSMPIDALLHDSSTREHGDALATRLASLWPSGTAFQVDVRLGATSYGIAEAARESRAALVVVGAGAHRQGHRVTAGRMASQILRRVRSPVLSVAPGFSELPRTLLIATDFAAPSIRAARDATRMMAPGGTIVITTVVPHTVFDLMRLGGAGPEVERANRLLDEFATRVRHWVGTDVTIIVEPIRGPVGEAIVRLARSVDADLIAIGTQGPNLFERFFVGSTAMAVLETATCSVLVAPPPTESERAELELESWGSTRVTDESAWSRLLDEFSIRNEGRLVKLEVDDVEYGAHEQATGYVLRGVAHDATRRHVDIMLARPGATTAHLTRSIRGALELTFARNASGERHQDRSLSIRSVDGDTLLTFTP